MTTLDKESAEAEFLRMCEEVGIDLDADDAEDADDLDKLKGKIVKAIEKGLLTIGESGLPTYTTIKNNDALAFKEPTGATLLSMDKVKDGHDMRKTYTVLGEITNGNFAPSKCNMRDIKVLTAIMTLFLAG